MKDDKIVLYMHAGSGNHDCQQSLPDASQTGDSDDEPPEGG